MGFLDLQSFCCGVAPLRVGCKIVALATTVFSFAVLSVGVSYRDQLISTAAYFLLFFAILLIYGVLERVKILLLTFLLLRALTAALELADIMRCLGMGINGNRDVIRVVLETMDLGMTAYFWLVVFSFCVKPESYNPILPPLRTSGLGGGGGGSNGSGGNLSGSRGSLFPNVPHYPAVPDEEPPPTSLARSRRASAAVQPPPPPPPIAQGSPGSAFTPIRRSREGSSSSPYNLAHQGRAGDRAHQASPASSSGEVFTYSGSTIPVTKATPLSPHQSPRSPRSPRHSLSEVAAPAMVAAVAATAGAKPQSSPPPQYRQTQQPGMVARPRPHPRAENIKYHAAPSGNPFL